MSPRETEAQRVWRRQGKLQEEGARPVQFWVPDTRSAGFEDAYAQQARIIRAGEDQSVVADDDAWFEISDKTSWAV